MTPIPAEEYQGVLLRILKAFKTFCAAHDLQFLLAGGTALGAVRHKGFIPWDDDIDLYVPHGMYEKLIALSEEDPFIDPDRRYKLLPPCQYPTVYPFVKVIDTHTVVYEKNISKKYATGAWIDVFPLSYWPDDMAECKRLFRKYAFYKAMNKVIIGGNYRVKKYRYLEILAAPVRRLLLLFGMDSGYWCRKIRALDKYRSGAYMGNLAWSASLEQEHFRAEWFSEVTEIEFEGDKYPVEKEYDKVLTCFYGDYMTLPPPEQRIRHNPEAYYLD